MLATGVYHAITLSKYHIASDPNLIAGALCFWNPIFNHFQFRFGPIGPIVIDICHILRLFSHGEDAHLYIVESDSLPIKTDPKSLGYTNFMSTHMGSLKEVSNSEFYYFLLYWLSKHLFCTSSQRVVLEFSNLTKAIAAGRRLALDAFVLGSLYMSFLELCYDPFLSNQ